ncbi:hypothetical protein BJ878DRAFT_104600 [Calycina marina]|uniref:Uncharacterized protein n=1 Tax=Calycina marina TaxID=1763456 RepID=A0A9P7Z1P2_9HELO|nr:hypothetical protein BJ878DRAFT_104600 [Calycina marina]
MAFDGYSSTGRNLSLGVQDETIHENLHIQSNATGISQDETTRIRNETAQHREHMKVHYKFMRTLRDRHKSFNPEEFRAIECTGSGLRHVQKTLMVLGRGVAERDAIPVSSRSSSLAGGSSSVELSSRRRQATNHRAGVRFGDVRPRDPGSNRTARDQRVRSGPLTPQDSLITPISSKECDGSQRLRARTDTTPVRDSTTRGDVESEQP